MKWPAKPTPNPLVDAESISVFPIQLPLLLFLLSLYSLQRFSFIEKLNELKTENVEPLTSIAETTLRFREDKIKSENIREKILKNSPENNEDFFVVPKVVE